MYLGKERRQGVAVAHAGMLPKPHSSFRVPLVSIADPSLKFHSEDDSRAEPASCIDPLLAALRVATQKLLYGSLQGLHRLFACIGSVVVRFDDGDCSSRPLHFVTAGDKSVQTTTVQLFGERGGLRCLSNLALLRHLYVEGRTLSLDCSEGG